MRAQSLCLALVFLTPLAASRSYAQVTVIDNFESGNLAAWGSPCGEWTVTPPGRNSEFAVELTGTGCCGAPADHMLVHQTFLQSYGRYSFDLWFPLGAGIQNGDLLLQLGNCSALWCEFGPIGGDNSADFVSRVTGATGTALGCAPIHLATNVWHTVVVERHSNGVIHVFIDGILRMQAVESSLVAAGTVALAGHGTGVRFDNVTFEPLPAGGPSPPAAGTCPPFSPYIGCPLPSGPHQPAPPTGVSATTNERCRVVVTWENVSGETGFRILRNGLEVGTVGPDVLQFTDLAPAGSYSYCVKVLSGCSESAATCVTGASTPPPAFYAASGNYYEPVNAPLGWEAARIAAETYSFLSLSGHLATIRSSGESSFVGQLGGPDRWLGGYQFSTADEPGGGWGWVTGEPFDFTSWASGEPNNNEVGGERENYLEMKDGGGGWNDVVQGDPNVGFIVEYDVAQPLTPPSGCSASDFSATQVNVSWIPGSGAHRQLVYRNGIQIADVSASTSVFVDTPSPGTYSYCLRGVNPCGFQTSQTCDDGTMLAFAGGGRGGCPVLDVRASTGWREVNTILGPSTDGTPVLDVCALEGAEPIEGLYRLRIRENEREITSLETVRLLAVEHDPGQRVTMIDGTPFLGGRSVAMRAVTAEGEDITHLLNREDDVWFSGRAGDAVELSLAERAKEQGGEETLGLKTRSRDKRLAPQPGTRPGAQVAGKVADTGILIQARQPDGTWRTLAHHRPQELATSFAVATASTGPWRLLFLSAHRVDVVEGLDPDARPATGALLEPFSAKHGRLGQVVSRLSEGATEVVQIVPGDTLELEFPAPAIARGMERTLFLVSRGSYRRLPSDGSEAPRVAMSKPHPNPASRSTRLSFTLDAAEHVRLEIFDAAGRRLRTLEDGRLVAGAHERRWNLQDLTGGRVPSGIYLCRLKVGNSTVERKVVVMP